jgi:Fe-S-cluster-containing dehydrogenase component/anaerobic selenocysteine-containing dehydrogenase
VPNLNRRDFLKVLGVSGGASALSACAVDTNQYKTPVEQILPYVVKPEQVTPGTPTFFATTVTRGPRALPVTARHRDGRVVFVSANTRAPTGPAVPPMALFEMQQHYSPDRVRAPRVGDAEASWADGVAKFAGDVAAARANGKTVAYLGGYKSGAIVELLNAFTGGNALFWEPAGYEAEVKAAELLFGRRVLPFYAYQNADYVLTFGAPFLGGWGDADTGDRFAKARNPNIGHSVARLATVSPHRDLTGVNADDWYACTPGSELAVARAVASLVASKKGASAEIVALIGEASVEAAAAASGLSAEAIQEIAERFANGRGLALPGGATGDTDLAAATYLLNLAADASGERFNLGGYAGPVSGFDAVEALVAQMNAGAVGVLVLDDTNPAYALPAELGFAAALAKVGTVVSVSSAPSETVALASMVLPTSGTLEDWGDEAPFAGLRLMRQPAMQPLYGTWSLGGLLLRAHGGEGSEAITDVASSMRAWREYVASNWRAALTDGTSDFTQLWQQVVVDGFVKLTVDPAAVQPVLTAASYAFGAGVPAGSGDLFLHVHPHTHRGDGRYANEPWAQEVPDPLTGIVWDSWLEVGVEKAKELGLEYNDLVRLSTPAGSVEVAVVPTRGAKGDTVALALGQGHDRSGRYASGYGVNATRLFGVRKDDKGAFAWGPTKVSLEKTGKKGTIVTTFSRFGDSDEGRSFGVAVSAEKLAKVGDEPAAHPGELTGIHRLQLDKRLTDRGITDFYGIPDHPTYRFGLTVDINACSGCGACSVACYAENNLPIVGRAKIAEGREMGWIRINRYWETDVGGQDDVRFVPMMCQQCGHAGCENVCPVLATYHSIDGLNAMVYNRCVGTRYCSNACPFSARRFNYHTYAWPEPFNLMLNPDVTTRTMGVMEKCTFCVQRIRQVKSAYRDGGHFNATVPSEVWEQVPACVEACPSQALTFGNLNDENGKVAKSRQSGRTYEPLGDLNVFSAVNYLAKANFHFDPTTAHHAGPGAGAHGDEHAATDHGGGSAHEENHDGAHDEGHPAGGH